MVAPDHATWTLSCICARPIGAQTKGKVERGVSTCTAIPVRPVCAITDDCWPLNRQAPGEVLTVSRLTARIHGPTPPVAPAHFLAVERLHLGRVPHRSTAGGVSEGQISRCGPTAAIYAHTDHVTASCREMGCPLLYAPSASAWAPWRSGPEKT